MAQNFLQIDGLTKSFGDLVLFENISLSINEGDRVGLIARNGSGKTTLLNMLCGDEGRDSGSIVWRKDLRVEYLSQDPKFPSEKTIGEICGEKQELTRILTKLKLSDMNQKVGHLSGGQLKRLALAHVLLDEPQFLVLDEPTNHLDLDMVEWLEEYLSHTRMTLLMVTHDRYFLDHVCNRIVELADKTLYTYKGNYAYFLEKRQERISVQNANVDRANNLLRTELDWMRRQPQARGHKSRSRIDAFYELEERAKRRHEQMEIRLQMKSSYIGNKIFEAHHVNKSFNADRDGHATAEKVILKDYNYTFARYEKMGIVGNNGTGKSTYLKMLQGLMKPDSGDFEVGETVRFGYYSQEGLQFDEQKKVIDIVRDIADYVMLSDGTKMTASQFLQNFLFSPEKQYSYVYKLSGGEKRRLYLCTILMRSPNFLILDEPTNDLDIVTLNVLEEFLQNFGGCVIVVSHDRYFMDKVVDHLLVFHGDGKLQDYPGNYTDWREYTDLQTLPNSPSKGEETASAKPASLPLRVLAAKEKVDNLRREDEPLGEGKKGGSKPRTEKAPKLSFKEKQEFAALEEELPKLEAEKNELEALMSSGTLTGPEIVEKGKRMQELVDMIDEKEMRWLELSEKA